MHTLSLLRGLRYVDSFFPSGGFAYSSGLEAAVQGGAVTDAESFARYVEDLLQAGLATREAVAAARAWHAHACGRARDAIDADGELDAMMLCRESRSASRQMGRQVIRAAGAEEGAPAVVREHCETVESRRTPGHLAVAYGLVLGAAGWTKKQTVAAFLYQQTVGFVSASFKLLPIGQREGQQLLDRWTPLIGSLSARAAQEQTMTAWTPVQDIYAMRHSRLTSRLFRS